MKFRSLFFSSMLLAVMLSLDIASVRGARADETEAWDEIPTESISMRKSEEERKAEFDKALSDIHYDVSDLDKLAFKDGLKRSKGNFVRLYRSLWKSLGMADKLERAVNAAFDENTKDMMWGTAGVQILWEKDSIVAKIQESVAFKFSEAFDEFLRDIEDKWGATLQKDVADFYHRTSIHLIAQDSNPMSQAFIRSSSAVEDKSLNVMERVRSSMQEKYSGISSGLKLGGGVMTLLLQNRIRALAKQTLGKTIGRKVVGSAVSRAAGKLVPVLGWVLTAWSVKDFISMAWNAPDDLRNMLQERNGAMYVSEMPEIYWDAMEPYVMDTFVFSFEKLQRTREEAERFKKNPAVAELIRNNEGDDAAQFMERLAALSGILGKAGYDDLVKDFGTIIRDSSRREFENLAAMLQQGNKLHVREWLNVAGTKFLDAYDSLPAETWVDFPPNKESFDALVWAMKLPPKARRVAVKLPMDDLKWIMNELPERFVSQLLGNTVADDGNKPDIIHAEIGRLAKLSDRESREPWQSGFSYWLKSHSLHINVVIAVLVLLVVLPLLLRIKNAAKRGRKEQANAGTTNPVVNINIPYPTQPAAIPAGKHSVRAKVSADLARELQTITWDVSQRLLPSDDGSDNRVLSVEMDDLDGIAKWMARNASDVEVLQPDELRAKIKMFSGNGGNQ